MRWVYVATLVVLIASTTHVDPVQLIPLLFAVTVGVPLVSVTLTSTRVPEQTGMRRAVPRRESGSMMLPVMKFTSVALLDGLCPFPMVMIVCFGQRAWQAEVGVGVDPRRPGMGSGLVRPGPGGDRPDRPSQPGPVLVSVQAR